MSYAPIALTIPQYDRTLYSDWWLKAYNQGTTTPLVMATDETGGTTLAKARIDAQGFPVTSSSVRFIPFINGDYDLWLFPTEADANANDTTNAIQFADNLNADQIAPLIADLADTTDISKGVALIGNAVQIVADASEAELIEPVSTRQLSLDGSLWDAVTSGGPYTSNGVSGSAGCIIALLGDNTKAWMRQIEHGLVDVEWWGALLDGVTDDHAAVQAAVNYSAPRGLITFISSTTAGCLISDTIGMPNFTKIMGLHRGHGFLGSTHILFRPTTPKSLFDPVNTGVFQDGFSIENLFIDGNSTTAAGNSIYAIDMDYVIKSQVKNVRTANFRYGIRCYATIHNRFENVHITSSTIACVLYAGGMSTTDVWDACYLSTSPLGVETVGVNLGILWCNNTIFETLQTHGMNLNKETFGWQVSDCYAENVCYDGTATNAMFRIGYDGTTLAIGNTITIDGGYYGGRNAGGVGSLLDVNESYGVVLGGFFTARWANIVKTGVGVDTNRIVCRGWTAVSVGIQVTDPTKCVGYYPLGVVNSGTRNAQHARFISAEIPNLTADTFVNTGRLRLSSTAVASGAGEISMGNTTSLTVGAAGAAAALPATPSGYRIEYHAGVQYKVPYYLQ